MNSHFDNLKCIAYTGEHQLAQYTSNCTLKGYYLIEKNKIIIVEGDQTEGICNNIIALIISQTLRALSID